MRPTIEPEPAKAARVAIDRLVLDAPGIRSVIRFEATEDGFDIRFLG
jgi:hypothetical protein